MINNVIELVLQKYPKNLFGCSFNDGDLGGCNVYGDPLTENIKAWTHLKEKYNIKTAVDIGCGFGFHTATLRDVVGISEVIGIEGSKKVVECACISEVVHNDYSVSSYDLPKIFDFAWSTEFLEHVDSRHIENIMKTLRSCKYVLITHGVPGQQGHHHVNCQPKEYWINIFKENGFEYNEEESIKCRTLAQTDVEDFLNWYCNQSNNIFGYAAKEHVKHKVTDYCNGMNYMAYAWLNKTGLFFKNTKI
jgi:SAM-dependent methyltransferase